MPWVTASINHHDRQEEKHGKFFCIPTLLSSCFLNHFLLWCADKDLF